ncbi:PEP-CTERM sorting domain-containing protein [bacterium]|nr:MAG: PEP-CTERM sorting domain-containing protein [bacterium]
MNRILFVLSALALTGAASANIVVNGSFELPFQNGGYTQQANDGLVGGWYGVGDNLEIGTIGIYGASGGDGLQLAELDSAVNYALTQDLATTSGSYTLSFESASRGSSSDFEVWFDGVLVDTVSPSSSTFAPHSYTVAASGPNAKLQFIGIGDSNGYGGLIDNVSVNAVPEPMSMLALAGGLGVVLRRRRKSA